MHVLEAYLEGICKIYATGGATRETSYYGVFESLLNEVGSKLKPKVRAVPQIINTGAGQPDFGLYAANQFQHARDDRPIQGALPERGVIEVKGWADDSFLTAKKEQVSKYSEKYGLVLVTNYRDFVLVGRDGNGKPVRLETYRMADSEEAFRALLAHPRKAADEQGDRLLDFLRRVLLYEAALTQPEDLAWFLASYAREARCRVEAAKELPALAGLKKGLEEALGMVFEGEKGEHFFQATLVQTLFYGVFSSWVLWSREQWGRAEERFDWHKAAWTLHVPMVASLFNQIATPQKLKPLGVAEVLDWAAAALNRVNRPIFFTRFEEEHAVQYFYEPFLKAYDPELRKELGVWYTPPEIVQYQVERVDRVLREELEIPDGLADDNVVILDPCCGTGAYLIETLKRIHKTLEEKDGGALTAQKVKKAAIERVFGFEILPAPFVVSHLQLGLMLRRLGAPLDHETDQRVGVYLTNALTGWEPPKPPKTKIADKAAPTIEESEGVRETETIAIPSMPELVDEVLAARKVKRERKILVILGNPPYNAFAGTSPEEEGDLVGPYKEGLTTPLKEGGWGIMKFNLDDLYVRFFRIAERRITKTGMGVISFISNHSWINEPSFVVLRKRLLESFDKFWIENMHGNRKISEYAPDGRTSETIFAIPGFSSGIQQGVVLSLWVRRATHKESRGKLAEVLYRDDISAARAVERRLQLLASLKLKRLDRKYETASPAPANRYSFRPSNVSPDYLSWPLATVLAEKPPYNGPIERRGNSLIVFPHETKDLCVRLAAYLNPTVTDAEMRSVAPAFMKSSGEFNAVDARNRLKNALKFEQDKLVSYPFKPFDVRIAYLDAAIAPLFSRPAPQLLEHSRIDNNAYFITRDTADKSPEGPPFYYSKLICDYDSISGHARHFPIRICHGCAVPRDVQNGQYVFEDAEPYCVTRANLSEISRRYLDELQVGNPDASADMAALIWMHALAVGYSPAYLSENADGIRQDWPRIPLPAKKKALLDSAALGRRVAALLDTGKPVIGVTCGKISSHLKNLGVIRRRGGGSLDPDAGELALTAGWGHTGKDGVCMPGKGKIDERNANAQEPETLFGTKMLDVCLNGIAYWSNVPRPIWDYIIGGYQVIKKWLGYREEAMLGRSLTMEEAEYVTEMVRRIAALILLQRDLDKNYETVKSGTWTWPGTD